MSWERVGNVAPSELSETRLELHWAAQLVAAVGSSLAAPKPDDSHTALTCVTERSLLVSAPAPKRVGLSMPDVRIVLLDDDLAEGSEAALEGQTLPQALDWIAAELGGATLARAEYEMPAHPIQNGAAFGFERPESFEELSRWFVNAARVLRALDLGEDRLWPHHFDLAALQTLDGERSVGVGLSPGDGNYDEPYWYVSPWPYPAAEDLPELPSGHWHHEGFVAAILTGSDITAESDAASQRAKVDTFLDAAIASSRRLVG